MYTYLAREHYGPFEVTGHAFEVKSISLVLGFSTVKLGQYRHGVDEKNGFV